MDKLEVRAHPTFIVYCFALIYFGYGQLLLNYLVALSLHEYSHYFVARRLGYNYSSIVFMPYGVSLNGYTNYIKPIHEVYIAIAGPLMNVLLIMITVCLWWCVPVMYNYTYIFVLANISLALVNVLPVYPLDGGRVMHAMCHKHRISKVIYKGIRIAGLLCGMIVVGYVVISGNGNISYFTFGAFVMSAYFSNDDSAYYKFDINKASNTVLPIKQYLVDAGLDNYALIKNVSPDNYAIFYVRQHGKIVAKLTEDEVINKFNQHRD